MPEKSELSVSGSSSKASRKASASSCSAVWISSIKPLIVLAATSRGTACFSPVSRRTTIPWFWATSRGPISTRTGTPLSSQSVARRPTVAMRT